VATASDWKIKGSQNSLGFCNFGNSKLIPKKSPLDSWIH